MIEPEQESRMQVTCIVTFPSYGLREHALKAIGSMLLAARTAVGSELKFQSGNIQKPGDEHEYIKPGDIPRVSL